MAIHVLSRFQRFYSKKYSDPHLHRENEIQRSEWQITQTIVFLL